MKHTPKLVRAGLLSLGLLLSLGSLAQPDPALELLSSRMEQLNLNDGFQVHGVDVAAVRLIPRFYEARDFKLAWTRQENVDALVRLVANTTEHGLNPEDYHLGALRGLLVEVRSTPKPDPSLRVDLDILLTDSLIRLAYHYNFGKVVPGDLDPNWNFGRRLQHEDPVQVLGAAIASESLEKFIDEAIPEPYFYRRLREALAQYREIKHAGGWPTVPPGATLRLGDRSERVAVLRDRLRITGDLEEPEASEPNLFDESVEAGVKAFQTRHSLDVDGAVGPKTRAALNVPVEARLDQIRVNMERIRWVYRDLPPDFILTDIAGFHVYLVRGGEIVWDARAQVGKPYRKTPVFRDTMNHLVFNPTWTVPPTILRKDILPKVQRDPDYLRRKNISVLDRNGKALDIDSIDWASLSPGRFPYILRQEPGPDNALGRVKFMFPNAFMVYLHDTPSKTLFGRTQRAFSSGCIRVERPFEFAELLLNNPQRWNQAAIQKVLDTQQTRTIMLEDPLPVLLLYWTTEVDETGRIHFREDIYGRDERILKALNGGFVFSAPTNVPDWVQSMTKPRASRTLLSTRANAVSIHIFCIPDKA
ncbi:MAG: L,D-transpeptidase family protein [Gammaproteobacteria bacterium]